MHWGWQRRGTRGQVGGTSGGTVGTVGTLGGQVGIWHSPGDLGIPC